VSTPPPDPKDALRTAIAHIEHMAAWITAQNAGYSFESLGEDMPNIRAALKDEEETYVIGTRDGYESAVQDFDLATGGDGEFKGSTVPGQTVDVGAMKERVLMRFSMLDGDKARLDFLDEANRRLNAYTGSSYRWELIMNHLINRLMLEHLAVDLSDQKAHGLHSCRDAIDEQMRRVERDRKTP